MTSNYNITLNLVGTGENQEVASQFDGLRAGEVVSLRLEDFDWEREVLTVRHGKRQRPRIYPLCRAVGDAVLRYLRQVRPKSARREVFLNLRAPFGPLSCCLLGHLVRQRLRALGGTLRYYGPHAIRHTTATHMLRTTVDPSTIRAWLGHVSLITTNVYAEVDLEMKAKALANCEIKEEKRQKPWREDKGLMEFLRTL